MQDQLTDTKKKQTNSKASQSIGKESSLNKGNLRDQSKSSSDLAKSQEYFNQKLREFERNQYRF